MSAGALSAVRLDMQPRRASIAQTVAQVGIVTLVCASILAPAITLTESLPWVKAEQALLPVVFLGYGWMLLSGSAQLIRFNRMFIVGAIFSLSIILSIWYGGEILHHEVLLRDYYEIPKAWLPVVFFTIALEANLSESGLRRLLDWFAGAVLIICIYAWAQFANVGFTYWLNTFYSGGTHIDIGLLNHGRVYSTMGNANVLGQLMTWSIVAFTLALLFAIGSRLRNIVLLFACLVTLGMTGSRYGLITTAIGVALIFVLPSGTGRRRVAQLSLFLLFLPGFVWAFNTAVQRNEGNAQRLASLRHPLEVDSLRARLDYLWRDAADDFLSSPVFGYGPAKIFYTGVFTDSEYLDVLKEFGLIGFPPYIAYYLVPMFLLWRGLRAAKRAGSASDEQYAATRLTLRLAFLMAVTALLMNIGESTFYNQLLQAFLWMWFGLGVNAAGKFEQIPPVEYVRYQVKPFGSEPSLQETSA